MKPLNLVPLAPLAPFNSPPAPCSTSTNPGCTDPASQAYTPASPDRAISRTACPSPTISSDGEMQMANQHLGNLANGTVLVSAGSGAVVQASGENGQLPNKPATVTAATTGHGLPRDILTASQNHARMIPPEIADCRPPAVDVAAGSGHPGGLATNVNIR